MRVREVAGVGGTLSHVEPSVWKADGQTLCILLDNQRTGRCLVITVDLDETVTPSPAAPAREVA